LREKTKELELKWQNEKSIVIEIRAIKKDLESLRLEAENAEMRADLSHAAEIPLWQNTNFEKRSGDETFTFKKTAKNRVEF